MIIIITALQLWYCCVNYIVYQLMRSRPMFYNFSFKKYVIFCCYLLQIVPIGQKVQDPLLHLCEKCSLPILVYGRLVSTCIVKPRRAKLI